MFLTTLGAAWVLWQGQAPGDAALPAPASPVHSQPVASAHPVPTVGASSAAAPGATPAPLRDTLAKFNTARSYRAFIYDLNRTGAAGEAVYARSAVQLCIRARHFIKDASLTNPQQRAAAANVRGRCDMSEEELATEFDAVVRKAGDVGKMDATSGRLIAAESAYDRAGTQVEEKSAVAGLLATQDPFAMYRLAGPPSGSAAQTRHFMGREYDVGPNTMFDHAFELAICEFGLDCGPDSPSTLMLCARRNWCAASYRDAFMAGLGPRFAQVDELAAQLVLQMKRQNAGAFIPSN